jgi:hypothetical protein
MRIARRQDNWFGLLRTVLAWSRILVEQGHVRRARRCLSPVVGHFPDEGYEIPDFQAAQALLASLRS